MVYTVKILFGEYEIEANSHSQAMEIFGRIFGENWRYLRTENEISYWELGATTATVREGKAKDYEAN
jgi:hypothetical protein